jgi:iron complex outermembrane receptor protein
MKGTTSGLEVWASYQATRRLRLSGGFNGFTDDLKLKTGSNDLAGLIAQQGRDPKRSWRLRMALDLPRDSQLDVIARRVSERLNPTVPAYSAVDVRYGWKPRRGIELSVTGQNLLGDSHGEFSDIATRTELGRAVFVKLVSHFGRGS